MFNWKEKNYTYKYIRNENNASVFLVTKSHGHVFLEVPMYSICINFNYITVCSLWLVEQQAESWFFYQSQLSTVLWF